MAVNPNRIAATSSSSGFPEGCERSHILFSRQAGRFETDWTLMFQLIAHSLPEPPDADERVPRKEPRLPMRKRFVQ